MNSIKDRLLEFIQYLGIGQTKFEESANLSRGLVSNIKGGIQQKSIAKITRKYPELNMEWLLNGDGEMLKNNGNYIGDNNSGNVNQNSGTGSITNFYGESPECAERNMERDERSEESADAVMHKMLDIVIDRFDAIEKEIAERNKMHDKLLDIIRQKDSQIDKLIDKIKD